MTWKYVIIKIPKCELPNLIIRNNIGSISAANSRLLLLSQCRRLHWSSAGPTTAAFVDCLSLPTFNRNLAQYRPYTKPIVTFTMATSFESRPHIIGPCVTITTANHSGSDKNRVWHSIGPLLCRKQVLAARVWARIGHQVHTGVIIPATARYWQPIFDNIFADAGPVLGRI